MGVPESQSSMCWLFTSLLLALEAEGFVAKDGDLFEEFTWYIKLAANFHCSSANLVHLSLRKNCQEFYVSYLPASFLKAQKDELLSSKGAECLFFDEALGRLVLDFHEDTSLATQLALQKVVSEAKSPLVSHSAVLLLIFLF